MLIIFDVDGTLVGGESIDWQCFDEAFLAVTGAPFPEGFFSRIEEVTAKAIVHQALADSPAETRSRIEEEVCREYLALLERAHSKNPDSFPPTTGALEVLAYLEAQDNLSIAIATGDWTETISFKLEAASIETAHYPMATSSDRYARSDIIRLSAERAGNSLEEAIYIGDGIWDYRATKKLGIPFLGVGHRHDQFLEAGVVHALQSLEPTDFIEWFRRFSEDRKEGIQATSPPE